MKHFINITTLEEAKKLYRELAKQHHPDRGGDAETMKEINAEYDFICAKILKGENLNDTDYNTAWNNSQLFKDKINAIINLEGIIIEICGLWIWVTGNTYPNKTALKQAGFYFASKKCAWFYRPESAAGGRGKLDLEQIRTKYGAERVQAGHRYAAPQLA